MALATNTSRSSHLADMPHMYPEAGPAEDCESSAERKLYYRLRETLGPEFHVIHSVKWNTIAANGRMQPGEADFVVIHPALGIAILEVKGGRVTQEPRSGRWYTVDRHDKKSRIQDPYNQAMKSAKVLERKLRNSPATSPFAESYRVCYGVWFPDTTWNRDGRGELRMLDEQTLDLADMQHPLDAITRLMQFAQGASPAAPLTEDALSALLSLLVPDLSVIESPLSEVISADDAAITNLTDEQADRLMAMWQSHRQMAIPGHAGTGKTAIAMEMAWRLAKAGNLVLLLCANRTLADHLGERLLSSKQRYDPHHFEIRSLHQFVNDMGVLGRVRHNEIMALTINVSNEQDTLADILAANLDALEQHGKSPVYDAVIVDEAQDINAPFWPQLRRLLRASDIPEEPAASNFYVFYDPAQRELPGEWDPKWTGIEAVTAPLTINCRNSAGIYELMAALNPRLHDAPFRGPLGRPVLYRDPVADATTTARSRNHKDKSNPAVRLIDPETATLEQVLNELVEREGVRPEQILVVTCRSGDSRSKNPTRWRVREQQEIGRRSLEWLKTRRSATRVSLATIRSSKGLESPVVVLAELDGIAGDGRHDQLLYTAISRAKHELIVLASPESVQPNQPGWWERFFKRSSNLKPPRQATSQQPADDPYIGPDDPDDAIASQQNTRAQDSTTRPKAHQEEATAASPSRAASDESSGKFVLTHYHDRIFDFVRNGKGDGIVSAVAGSGKTTTLLEAARLLTTRSSIFLAFNKHIANELSQKLLGTPMSARTIHSVGFTTLLRYLGNDTTTVDEHKYTKFSHAWAQDNLTHLRREEKQLATKALNALANFARATLTDPADFEGMRVMAMHFSVDNDAVTAGVPLDTLIEAASHLIEEGDRLARGEEDGENVGHVIDFLDMVYLPHIWQLPAQWHADWVFVDEAQDLNAAQLELALKCRAPGGRMLFVGDRHQAIYGFSGADSNSIDHIKARTSAEELRLSICYRCPPSHVALAKELVPEIEADPTKADPGEITHVESDKLPKLVAKDDLILCRKTAPLVELCIKLISHRIFARVKGRAIGTQLTLIVQQVAHLTGHRWPKFGQFLEEYKRQQVEKLRQFENCESEVEDLMDRIAAVEVCYAMFEAKDASDLCRKIDGIFNDGEPDVVLSTVHRAKGLEAKRIFLLNPHEMPLKWPNQQAWELEQERNIKYVALTRSKGQLYMVRTTAN